MAWDKGFNFRSTSGYVTDGTDETYVLAGDNYPVTRNGVTFGYTTGMPSANAKDRSTSNDVRLAGTHVVPNTPAQETIRVDLNSAADYDIRLALGDGLYSHLYTYVQLLDNATAVLTITDTNGQSGNAFLDATGAEYTAPNWPGSNTKVTKTFATTTFFMTMGSPDAQSDKTPTAHLFLSEVATGGATGKSNPLYGVFGGPLAGSIS